MTDSFFTSRNQFDGQMQHFPDWMCMQLIEAGARRIIALQGHVPAAVKLQRLADVCAAAHVMPIEHWRELPAPTREPEEPSPLRDWYTRIFGNPTVTFYLGFAAAWMLARIGS